MWSNVLEVLLKVIRRQIDSLYIYSYLNTKSLSISLTFSEDLSLGLLQQVPMLEWPITEWTISVSVSESAGQDRQGFIAYILEMAHLLLKRHWRLRENNAIKLMIWYASLQLMQNFILVNLFKAFFFVYFRCFFFLFTTQGLKCYYTVKWSVIWMHFAIGAQVLAK